MEKKEHKGGLPLEVRKAHFIERAVALWGDVNDYSLLQYTNGKEPCIIHCRAHGPYRVAVAQNHILKEPRFRTGCPWCTEEKTGLPNNRLRLERRAKEKAERKAKQAERERKQQEKAQIKERHRLEIMQYVSSHGYDVDNLTWRQITQRYASIKGRESDFMQQEIRRKADRLAEEKRLRAEREAERIRQRTIELIEKAKAVHGDRYDYSQAYYEIREHRGKRYGFLCNIICKTHGPFDTRPGVHISQGCHCPRCAGYQNLLTPEQHRNKYIETARKRFDDRYDYSMVRYINKHTPVILRCKKHNYTFEHNLENHSRSCGGGCIYCENSAQSEGEIAIKIWLAENGIAFVPEYKVYHGNLFCRRQYLKADFYLPDHNMFIEFHGQQHYEDIPYFFENKKGFTFADQQERDETLRMYCRKNGIRLLEIKYDQFDNIPSILEETLK